ncbi:MAG: GNAT family protein [Dehalococcoidia bacterium]
MTAPPSSSEAPFDIWRGALVRLRAVEPEDATALRAQDDSQVQRQGHVVHFPSSAEAQREWATERAKRSEDDRCFLAIERLEDAALVGTISVWLADQRHGRFALGLALYRPYWRQGLGSDAVLLLLRYYFTELRYMKCEAGVYAFNDASLGLFHSLGFVEEGRRRSAVFTLGRRWDDVLFGMTAAEFAETHPAYAEHLADQTAE